MNIGGLTIEMMADIARLRQDMESVKSSVGGAMGGVQKAVDVAKAAFVALAGVAGVSAFAGMVNGAINAEGALHDMSKTTGLSVAALRQFREMGAYTETSTEAIAGAALKLSKNLALTDEDGKGAALALKALGLNFNDFVKLNPEQRMLTAATALDKYEDGADKSAVAMMLFGKEGAKLLPFFGDLAASSDEIAGALTEQQIATRAAAAAMADDYGDNLTKIQKQGENWKKEISLGLLPVMHQTTAAFIEVAGSAGGIGSKIDELAQDGTLAEWARGGVIALTYLLDVGQGLLSLFPLVGKTIAGIAAGAVQTFTSIGSAVGRVLKGDFSGALDEIKSGLTSVSTIGQDTANDISAIWNQKLIGESFRDSMTSLRGVQAESREAKRQLNLADVLGANEAAQKASGAAIKASAEEQKKLIAAYEAADKAGQDLIASLTLKNEQMQLEVDYGRKLTAVEIENIKLTKDLASGKVLLSQAGEEAARAAIEHGASLEREIAWQQESHKSNLALIDSTDKLIESLQAETEKQRAANEEMGLTTEQLGELRQAKLEDLAVQAERKAALLDEIDWTGQLGDQQRELAKAYRESAAVAGDGTAAKAAKDAQDAWGKTIDSIGQGLTDSLFRAFESGKGFWDTLWDGIKNTLKSTVLKIVIQGVDGNGGIVGSIMSLFGGGGGGAGGAAGGGASLSGLGSLFGTGLKAFGEWMGGESTIGSLATTVGSWMKGETASTMFGQMGMGWSSGTSAMAAGNAGGGWNTATTMWNGGNTAGAVGQVGGMAAGAIGGFMAGRAVGQMVSGGYSAVGSGSGNSMSNTGAAIGAAIGSIIPGIGTLIGGLIGGALGGVVNRAFGHKAKEYNGDKGLEGMFSAGGASGQAWAEWTQKGGWFRSDKHGTDKFDMEAQAAAGLAEGAKAVLEQTKAWATALGLPAEQLASVTTAFRVKLTDSEEANQKALAEAFGNYAQDLANSFGEFIKPLQKAGETVSQTLERISALQGFSRVINDLGGVFSDIANSSLEAREGLIVLAGGIEQLTNLSQQFVADYYSETERAGLDAKTVSEALKSLGIDASGVGSREDFRALVESLGAQVESAEARQQLVGLLALGPQFAQLADYLKEQGLTLAQAAEQAPQVQALQSLSQMQASAQSSQLAAAEQSAKQLQTANDQLADISSNGAASVAVQQEGFTKLIKQVEQLAEALNEVVRPGQLAEMAR